MAGVDTRVPFELVLDILAKFCVSFHKFCPFPVELLQAYLAYGALSPPLASRSGTGPYGADGFILDRLVLPGRRGDMVVLPSKVRAGQPASSRVLSLKGSCLLYTS